MTEPYVPATPGDPILASKWNTLQVTIRDKIEALEANKLNLAGGSVGGPLSVTGPLRVSAQLAVGLGNDAPQAAVDVRNTFMISAAGGGGLRLTNKWDGFPDSGPNRAQLAVDSNFQTLMIVGSRTGALANPDLNWPGSGRRVSVWDRLEVNGHTLSSTLSVGHFPTTRPLQMLHVAGRVAVDQGVIQRGGPAITETADLGLYSQVQDNAVRLVTRNGPIRFFADGGVGGTANLDVLPTGDLKVRRNVSAAALGIGIDPPAEPLHIHAPSGNIGIRLQSGVGANDWTAIRHVHGGNVLAWTAAHGATGRWTVNNTLSVLNGRVGVGTGGDLPTAALEVRGDLQVRGGAIVPEVGNSESAGIQFPRDPGGGSSDRAFIRYHVEANETTTLRIGIGNDPDDTLRLYQQGGDRVHLHNGVVTISSAPYSNSQMRLLNVENEIKSFGGSAGLRMSDRAAPTNSNKDWVLYPNGDRLNFWQAESGDVAWLTKDGRLVLPRKLQLGNKWLLSGDGDIEANDDWLRLKAWNATTAHAGNSLGYYGGFACWNLWSYQGVNKGSDLQLKRDVATLEASLDHICQLRGVRYRSAVDPSDRQHLGLIAQEVQQVFPELVAAGPEGLLGIQYDGLIGPLVEAIKEQQQQIAGLRRELADLRERIA